MEGSQGSSKDERTDSKVPPANQREGQHGDTSSELARRERQRQRRREAVRLADLTTVGLVFPIAIVIGFLGGRFIGGLFDAAELGGWIGGGLGIVSGFYNVFKTARMLASQDERSGWSE